MIEITVPGRGVIRIEHLVCDVNGTLALEGRLIDGVAEKIENLRGRIRVHLLTANTHDRQDDIDRELNLTAIRMEPGDEAGQKARFVQQLGAEHTVAIGNGANDAGMLAAAALGICVLSPEGLSIEAFRAADILAPDIRCALELVGKPLRIVATLRK
jgi:P-type E1-E2 ATPase